MSKKVVCFISMFLAIILILNHGYTQDIEPTKPYPFNGKIGSKRVFEGTISCDQSSKTAIAKITIQGLGKFSLRCKFTGNAKPIHFTVRELSNKLGATNRLKGLFGGEARPASAPKFELVFQDETKPSDELDTSKKDKAEEVEAKLKITIKPLGTWSQKILGIPRPSPGNSKKFKAIITPATEKRKIKFILIKSSAEQGICLNKGKEKTLDLTFEKQQNFAVPAGNKQNIVESKADNNTAIVTLSAHDYGAFGKIKAVIDGTAVESTVIPILEDKRPATGNNIEDAWDRAFTYPPNGSLHPSDDNDEKPKPGDYGVRGDSLSRYEEYRGFMIGGVYKTLNPQELDVFVIDLGGIGEPGDFTKGKIKLTVHTVIKEEFETYKAGGDSFTKINPNRGYMSAGVQGVIRVTKDNTLDIPGQSHWSNEPPGVKRTISPAGNYKTSVNVAYFSRFVRLAKPIKANTPVLPLSLNPNPGDVDQPWTTGGKTNVGGEVVDIIGDSLSSKSVKLAAPASKTAKKLIINMSVGASWDENSWGTLDPAGKEFVSWGEVIPLKNDAKIVAAITPATTKIKLDKAQNSAEDFNWGDDNSYIVIDDEILLITDANIDILTVKRGQLGTTAVKHAKNSAVQQRTVLTGVGRGLAGSTAIKHKNGTVLKTIRGLLIKKRTGSKAHPKKTKVPYFFSKDQTLAAIRMTFAHECAHTCGFDHIDDVKTIMIEGISKGAIDGNGIYHQFDKSNFEDNLNVKNDNEE